MSAKRNEEIARSIVRSLGEWEPVGISVALIAADRESLRSQALESISGAVEAELGIPFERLMTIYDVERMTVR